MIAPNGVTGSGTPVQSLTDGDIRTVQMTIASNAPSPVSNSNLPFVPENAAGSAMAIANVLFLGVWV